MGIFTIYLGSDHETAGSTAIQTRINPQIKEPSMYTVLLLNDDFTPMDFVIAILEKYFDKDHTMANEIMLNIHLKGKGICGVYPYDIAETKAALVIDEARNNEYPLECILEKASP